MATICGVVLCIDHTGVIYEYDETSLLLLVEGKVIDILIRRDCDSEIVFNFKGILYIYITYIKEILERGTPFFAKSFFLNYFK